jgi:peroxiredoxin
MVKLLSRALTALAVLISSAHADLKVGDSAPDFEATDTEGKKHKLSELKGKIVVLEWTNHKCPFVIKHYTRNNMQQLQEKYTTKGVIWLSIVSSAPGKEGHINPTEANEIRKNMNVKSTATLLDESGVIGKSYDARTTPHMFVIDKEGKIAYMGAMDDKPTTNPDDITASQNYVAKALDALLEGKKIDLAQTVPYGCSVKYAS